MTDTDKPDFLALLTGALSFYRQDVSAFALSVWWEACKGYSVEQVRKALTAHAMDPERGRFPPMPADVVKALHGTHTDRSLMAWGKVYEAMRSVGGYSSVDFGDAATHKAIADMGGWPALCRSLEADLPHLQRRFCDSHRTYSQRGAEDAPAYLVGMSEQENAAKGVTVEARPARLGQKREPVRLERSREAA